MNSSDAIARLRTDEDFLREGVSVVVDAGLRRPLSEYVDVAVLTDVVSKGLGEPFVARLFEDHVIPSRPRIWNVVAGTTTQGMLPESVLPALEELAATMTLPRFAWLEGAIDAALIRELFSPVWREIFTGPGGPGLGDGLGAVGESLGAVGKGIAGAFAKVGSGAMKGMKKATGVGVDKAFTDFSEGVTARVRSALVRRVQSEEGGAIVEKIRRQLFARVLETDLDIITKDFERMPLDAMMRHAPAIVAHNAASVLGRRIVRNETMSILAAEGARSAREVFDEAGTLPEVRAYLRVTGEGLLRDLLDEDSFVDWVRRWLDVEGAS